jgi:predicted dehydrogenase
MDGGVLMNQGIHGVDLLRYLVGEVAAVSAISKTLFHKIEADDTTAAVLEFENGAVGTLEATTSVSPGYSRILEINGTRGSARLEENEIVRWDIEGESLGDVSTGLGLHMNGSADPNGISCLGHAMQIENMVRAVHGEDELINDVRSSGRTVELIRAIYRSAKTREKVLISYDT